MPSPSQDFQHTLLIGNSGTGKSILAASAETPQLIALFDSFGNARKPYLETAVIDGQSVALRVRKFEDAVILNGQAVIFEGFDCYAESDTERKSLLRRIWYFNSVDQSDIPNAHLVFTVKLSQIMTEIRECGFKTFIFDSLTSWQTKCRLNLEYHMSESADKLNQEVTNRYESLCYRLADLPITTIAISHTGDIGVVETKMIGNKATAVRKRVSVPTTAPGRMARKIYTCFSDVWECDHSEDGYIVHTSGGEPAKNSVDADAICPNDWKAITKNRKAILWDND